MTKTKSTKRALVSSALALMMCISMLIGSTFAWFTDSVTSSSNKIQSGTLKLDLEMLVKNDDNTTSWKSIKEDKTALFNYANWEPGYTDVKVLKVENEGSLALKWVAKFVAEKELSALANVIDVYVCPSESEIGFPTDRTLAGYTRVGTVAEFVNTIEETTKGTLEAEQEAYLGIALKMQETAGNEYQGLDLGGAFDIQILATQYTFEKDSFDNQYDKDALYPVVNASELLTSISEGKSVTLASDIKIEKQNIVVDNPGQSVVVDLAGNDLTIENDQNSWFGISAVGQDTQINLVNSSDAESNIVIGNMTGIGVANGGILNIDGCNIIVNGNIQNLGETIQSKDGTINFYNGTITVNSGIGFLLENSVFNMYGGTIDVSSGAIGVTATDNTVVNLNGGTIKVASNGYGVGGSGSTINQSNSFVFDVATGGVDKVMN